MRAYTFVKNIGGSLRITLDSYDMQLAQKDFFIPSNVEKIVVPYKYALGLFISDGAKQQFEQGYFTIEDYEELRNEAIKLGLAAGEPRKTISPKKIAEAVQNRDMDFINKILRSNNAVDIANLIIIVRENFGQVSNDIIQRVEDACGVELKVDE